MPDRSPVLLVCQISDLHIGLDGDAPDESATVRARAVIDRIAALDPAPDVVVLSGDLTDRGDALSYRRLRDLLAPLAMPVLPMTGNHDRRAAMLDVFHGTPTAGGFVQYDWRLGGRRIILLDTLDEGRGGGGFCAERAAWFDAALGAEPDLPTLVALHHPPFGVGIDWMDPRDDAPWIERLRRVVSRHPQIVALIAGHLHRPIAASWMGRPCMVASSVAPQLAPDLRATPLAAPDGRALVVLEPPAFVLHRWSADALASHFMQAATAPALVRLDASMAAVLAECIAENHSD